MSRNTSGYLLHCFYIGMLLVGLMAGAAAHGQSAVLPEDDARYDPGVPDQIGKTGAYEIAVPAIPTRLYFETADLNGALEDRNAAARMVRASPWMAPDGEGGQIVYRIYVPETYDPQAPPGVMVFIAAGDDGDLHVRYNGLMGPANLISIEATKSGNEVNPIRRQTLAIYAVEIVRRRYHVDSNRVYISGFSGGGRAASLTMYYRSDLFKGGVPMAGCMPLTDAPVVRYPGDGAPPGATLPGLTNPPPRQAIRAAAANNRYVFTSTEKDINRGQTEGVAQSLANSGFAYVTAIIEPEGGHHAATPEAFTQAIAFLDAPLIKAAVDQYNRAQRDRERGRLGDALDTLARVLPYITLSQEEKAIALAEQARASIAELEAQYDQAIASLEVVIDAGDVREAQQQLRGLRRQWNDRLSDEQHAHYTEQIREAQRDAR